MPEADFEPAVMREPTLGEQVNSAIEQVTGCQKGLTCPLPGVSPPVFFAAVTQNLRDRGLCAGRHDDDPVGGADEIAVAHTCAGPWQGYHIYAYTGYVMWSPASYRGDTSIKKGHCGEPPDPCGNGTCDAGESFEACPADCKKPEPTACPPSMDGWGDVVVSPEGNPYPDARLDFTSQAYPPWCREKYDRVFCPIPEACAEALVGPVTVVGEPGSAFNAIWQYGTNTHLWNFEGRGVLRVCGGVPTQRCALCEVDDAGVSHDHVTVGKAKCTKVE